MTAPAVAVRRRTDRTALVCAAVLGLIVLITLCAPFLAPHDPVTGDLAGVLQSPSAAHPFGTDELGRDLLSRVLHGGRGALTITAISSVLTALIAVVLAIAAATLGPAVDAVAGRLGDIALAVPTIVIAIVLLTFAGNSPAILVTVMVLGGWVPTFRLVRASARATLALPYVDAARIAGVRPGRIALRHVVPAVAPILVVSATASASVVLVSLSSLNYLGLGLQPPIPDWGQMVAAGQAKLSTAPWLSLIPGGVLAVTVFCLQMVGDAVSDRLGGNEENTR
ncbi:ABC transporter permease [Nocardia speluncae]|uniref:ABC transporter permease n=1 Tax=Nocardia speluncae TaxID=419477 RepID=A0A846XB43_9NOCA|nr:ABC transporter permease [Nocardia speluncae]NKY33511.1 ABC transporter permease [Nocardia speluncae]